MDTLNNAPSELSTTIGSAASKPDMDLMTTDSIADKLKLLKQLDAAITKIVYRKKGGTPMAAAIFVTGDETREVVDALDKLEASWD